MDRTLVLTMLDPGDVVDVRDRTGPYTVLSNEPGKGGMLLEDEDGNDGFAFYEDIFIRRVRCFAGRKNTKPNEMKTI